MRLFTVIMLAVAVALSGAALAVSLEHAGPQGPRGAQGAFRRVGVIVVIPGGG